MENFELTQRGVLIGSCYIISDTHLGYSDTIREMTSEEEFIEIKNQLESAFKQHTISEVVINGDFFHTFGSPSDETQKLVRQVFRVIKRNNASITIVTGNHDTTVEEYVSNQPVLECNVVPEYSKEQNNIYFIATHGHKKWQSSYGEYDLVILGHLHPVININGKKWPTYLHGSFSEYNILILPAFSSYQDGVVISDTVQTNIDFPFVRPQEFRKFKPLVYDETENTIKEFPRLSQSAEYFGL